MQSRLFSISGRLQGCPQNHEEKKNVFRLNITKKCLYSIKLNSKWLKGKNNWANRGHHKLDTAPFKHLNYDQGNIRRIRTQINKKYLWRRHKAGSKEKRHPLVWDEMERIRKKWKWKKKIASLHFFYGQVQNHVWGVARLACQALSRHRELLLHRDFGGKWGGAEQVAVERKGELRPPGRHEKLLLTSSSSFFLFLRLLLFSAVSFLAAADLVQRHFIDKRHVCI